MAHYSSCLARSRHSRFRGNPAGHCPLRASLAIARETGNRNDEVQWLGNLAEILSDEGHLTEAIQHALDAVKIGNEISSLTLAVTATDISPWLVFIPETYPQAVQLRKLHASTTCRKITTMFPRCWE